MSRNDGKYSFMSNVQLDSSYSTLSPSLSISVDADITNVTYLLVNDTESSNVMVASSIRNQEQKSLGSEFG